MIYAYDCGISYLVGGPGQVRADQPEFARQLLYFGPLTALTIAALLINPLVYILVSGAVFVVLQVVRRLRRTTATEEREATRSKARATTAGRWLLVLAATVAGVGLIAIAYIAGPA